MSIPIDYEILRLIWWLFLGVLLIGFAIMDGFDLGVATLLPFVARSDVERRVAINAIGPVWDGNQVWLLLGGGAIFAAWPAIYATAFSGFYIAIFLVLAALIVRPVGFEFRNKINDPRWRAFWDYALFVGGLVPSLVFGVAIGNLLQGAPFRIDNEMRMFYEGTGLFELLNPFGLLCGLVSLAMLVSHGATYLVLKTEGAVNERARWVASRLDRLRRQGLRDHQCDPGGRPVQSAAEDGRAGARRVADQLRDPSVDDARAYPGRRGSAFDGVSVLARQSGSGLRRERGRHSRHHRHRGRQHVPVLDAVQHRAVVEPDGVGRFVEPANVVRDAHRDVDLPPAGARLHQLGLLHLARAGYGVTGSEQQLQSLLRGKNHVVFRLDAWHWLRHGRSDPQRGLA